MVLDNINKINGDIVEKRRKGLKLLGLGNRFEVFFESLNLVFLRK